MKVSVVIPAYNEEKYIRRCLESLMRQEVFSDEIIVVDNNCTDNTVAICKEFPVRVLKERKQGMIAARNHGFNEAKYEIIARCDADTIVPSDWIKKIKARFDNHKIDALAGPISYYDLPVKIDLLVEFYLGLLKKIKGHQFFIGPNMILTKNIWQKVQKDICLDEKNVHEDIDLSIHIHTCGGIIDYDKSLKVYVSSRRMKKKPASFFIEYPIRYVKTLRRH